MIHGCRLPNAIAYDNDNDDDDNDSDNDNDNDDNDNLCENFFIRDYISQK